MAGVWCMNGFWHRLEALGLRLFLGVVGTLGVERASGLGERVLRLFGPCVERHKKVVRNLEIAFPGRDAVWHKQTAKAMWGDFGRSVAEYAYLPELSRPEARSRIEVVDHVGIDALREEERPIIFVAAHLANWNIPAIVGPIVNTPVSVLYRRRKNPHLEAVIEHWRNQMPCGFIDVDGLAPKAMLEELKHGRSIGLFIDRRTTDGEPLPFFGQDTPTPTIAARLALRTGAAFVPVRVERLPNVHFRITMYPPIVPDADAANDREAARQMTAVANRLFEDWISERPEQWLSTARRWPRGTPATMGETEADALA